MIAPVPRVILLAAAGLTGIGGTLLADSDWDWLFLGLAALPLILGGGAVAVRRIMGR